ncbi:MAG: phage tail protein [Bacilli bacterium]|nr:phage tail protein [Bacilli bacterium]
MISIYPSTEKTFSNNGIKILKPLKALIRKEDNGDFYIDLKDTIDNIDYYQAGMIIRTDTPWGYQAFRLSNPKIENNKISIKAKHVYFDSKQYVIKDSYVVDKNCNDALDHLNNACDEITPFTFISDISIIDSYRCVRKTLEEAVSEVINRWGGHLDRDNFNVAVRAKIGQDRGITISYMKNIKKMKTDEVWDKVVTKIMPVGKDGLLLPEVYLSIEEDLYDIPYKAIVQIDQNEITEDSYKVNDILDVEAYQEALINDLRQKGTAYLEENKYPKVNYSVDAYIKDVADIGDTIYVKHPKCKVDLTTNVIAIEYDCILKRYTKIEFGNFKSKLKNLISNISSTVEHAVKKTNEETVAKLENELIDATNQIKNAMGNSYCIYDGDKILVLDKLPKEEAKYVLMINNGGIGFSSTGINGTFNSAWTIDGTLNMQKINVINLVADMIKGGTLKLGSNLNEAGKMELYDEANKLICLIDKTGLTFFNEDNSYIKINPDVGFAGYDANGNKTYWVDGDEFHQKKSVVEEEITIASKLRMIPITTDTNDGIGFVSVV